MDNEPNENLNEEQNEEQRTTPDKGKYPHGEKEQPIGQWWQPDPGPVECPIGCSYPPEGWTPSVK